MTRKKALHPTVQRAPDGKLYVVVGDRRIPVLGTLSDKTTPDDFKRFAKIAENWWKHQNNPPRK